MTLAAAAQHLHIAPNTLRTWIKAGGVPGARKRGRDWEIPESALTQIQVPPGSKSRITVQRTPVHKVCVFLPEPLVAWLKEEAASQFPDAGNRGPSQVLRSLIEKASRAK